ncbi:MAG: transcription elongation factor GreB [Thioalkalispiraceae bacterium]
MTRDGYERLDQELGELWKRRAEVTRALSAAAAEGDRSENAEYIYRKKELAGIDRRIRYLQKRLPELSVVEAAPTDTSKVFFGAWVTVENEAGEAQTYRIVGSDEIDMDEHYISMDAPLAKALFKKSCDDEVQVQTPKGDSWCVILAISYSGKPD